MTSEVKIIDAWMQHPTHAKCLEDLNDLELEQDVKELFLHQNTARVFGI